MFCPNCGTELEGKEAHCPFCGTKIERARKEALKQKPTISPPIASVPKITNIPAPSKPQDQQQRKPTPRKKQSSCCCCQCCFVVILVAIVIGFFTAIRWII